MTHYIRFPAVTNNALIAVIILSAVVVILLILALTFKKKRCTFLVFGFTSFGILLFTMLGIAFCNNTQDNYIAYFEQRYLPDKVVNVINPNNDYGFNTRNVAYISSLDSSYLAPQNIAKIKKSLTIYLTSNFGEDKNLDDSTIGDTPNYKLLKMQVDSRGTNHVTSVSKSGKALLNVLKYYNQHAETPIHPKLISKPSMTRLTYEDETGKHNIVCYVNNQKKNNKHNETIIDY